MVVGEVQTSDLVDTVHFTPCNPDEELTTLGIAFPSVAGSL